MADKAHDPRFPAGAREIMYISPAEYAAFYAAQPLEPGSQPLETVHIVDDVTIAAHGRDYHFAPAKREAAGSRLQVVNHVLGEFILGGTTSLTRVQIAELEGESKPSLTTINRTLRDLTDIGIVRWVGKTESAQVLYGINPQTRIKDERPSPEAQPVPSPSPTPRKTPKPPKLAIVQPMQATAEPREPAPSAVPQTVHGIPYEQHLANLRRGLELALQEAVAKRRLTKPSYMRPLDN